MTAPRRIREPGYIFHVTARGNNRQDIFADDEEKRRYLDLVRRQFAPCRIRLYAYSIMSNHPHLLVRDEQGGRLPEAMHRVQLGYAMWWNRRHGRSGRVWGERYHAEPVDSDGHLVAAACYIHNNAPWAGLARNAAEYPWSSARAYLGRPTTIPVHAEEVLALCDGARGYEDILRAGFLRGSEGESLPESSMVRGLRVSGDGAFRESTAALLNRRKERRSARQRPRGLSIDSIIGRIVEEMNVSRDEICGPSRRRRVSRARALFCARARREGISASEIAELLQRSGAAVHQLAASVPRDALL